MGGLLSGGTQIVRVALEGLQNILRVGEKDKSNNGVNPYVELIEQAGGLDKMELLQHHDNIDVYRLSVDILTSFFEEDDDEAERDGSVRFNGFYFSGGSAEGGNGF